MERNPTNQYDAHEGKIVQTRYKDDVLLYRLYGPIGKVQNNQPALLPPTQNGQTTTKVYQVPPNGQTAAGQNTTKVYQFPVTRVNPNYQNTGTTQQTYQTYQTYQRPTTTSKPQTAVYQQTVYKEKEKSRRGWLWIIVPIVLLLLFLAAYLLRSYGFFNSPQKLLSAPENLKVNGYALTWDKVDYASAYIVDIDGGQLEVKDNAYSLAGLAAGEHSIKIKATGSDTRGDSPWSDVYKYDAKQRVVRPSNLFMSGGLLKWDAVPDTKYLIYINGKVYESDTNSFDLSSLNLPAGSYLVRVLARNADGTDSDWTEFYYNAAGVPAPVNLRLLANTLLWDNVAQATEYSVDINGTVHKTNTNSYTLQGLEAGGTYEIKVMAHIGASSSDWTPTYIYTAAQALPIPTNLTISNGLLQWTPILNASGYIVEIDGCWFYANSGVFSLFPSTTPMLGEAGTYTIRVFAIGDNSSDSMWTNPISYTVTKLSAPSDVQLNAGVLTWTASQNALRYVVEVNGVSFDAGTNLSFYVGTDPNLYNIRVMAEGNGWSVLDSEYSETINHKIVKAENPSNLQINGGLLTWGAVDGAVKYLVEVNDEIFEVTDNIFSLNAPAFAAPNMYNIKIKAIGNGADVLDSEWSEPKLHIVSVKLETPSGLSITNGILMWTSADSDSVDYTVTVSGRQYPTSNPYLDLGLLGLEPGTYEIRVMAKGNSMAFNDSEWSETILYTVIKLDAPENLEIVSGGNPFLRLAVAPTLTWSEVLNAEYYIVLVNEIPYTVYTPSYSLAGLTPGVYIIKVKSVGNAPDYIESDWSAEIRYEVFKLSAPENITISNTILMWNNIANTTGYVIKINDNEIYSDTNNYDLKGLLPGSYQVLVKALGDEISHFSSEWSSNAVPYTVYRLAEPENLVISDGILTWDTVANASRYNISINNVEYIAPANSFSLLGLVDSTYKIKVQALGNNVTHYDSDWSSVSDYIVERLDAPSGLQLSANILTWAPVANALSYIIDIDGARYTSVQASLNTSFLTTAKTYTITVQAVGNEITFLNSAWSANFMYTVTKLAAPTVTISGTNAAWNAVANASGYYVRVNNGSAIAVSGTSYSLTGYTGLGNYSVQVMTRGNNSNFIDSDWSASKIYTVTKLQAPTTAISGKVVSWTTVANASSYTVYINNGAVSTQTGTSYTLNVAAVGTYNVQIRTNGNGVNYLNSDLSNTVSYKIVTPPRTDGCVVAGTLVTLADGTKKAVEQLNGSEMLLVWNFLTGTFDTAPVQFIKITDATINDMIQLRFSDGTTIKIARVHGFFNSTLNKFVYITKDNAQEFKGHYFNKQTTVGGNLSWTKVQLISITVTTETVTVYNPVTYRHLSSYLNGMLTMPAGSEGIVNIFEVNASTMQYDMEKYYKDILTYGLFTYDDLSEYMPQVMFDALNGQYFKIAIAKGLLDMEKLPEIFTHFAASLELHTPIVH